MAKTFNDFMIECTAYPHSQEHLDLMKECAELQLTCQYLSNQAYMQENSHLFGENVQLAEGYLTESVDDYTIEQLCESANSKSKAIHLKIWRGIQKILNVFRNFFSKLSNKFDDTTIAAKKARERLEKVEITPQVQERLEQIVQNGLKKADSFVPHDRQPFTKKLKMKKTDNSPEYTKLRANLAAALSDDVSVAEAFASKGTDNMGAIPAEDIESAMEDFLIGGKSNLAGCLGKLTSSFAATKVDGISIKVNTGEIKATAKRLEKIQEKLNKKVQKMVDEANAYSNQVGTMGAVAGAAAGAVQREAEHTEAHKESVEYFEERKTGKKQARAGGPKTGSDSGEKSFSDKLKEGIEKAEKGAKNAAAAASKVAGNAGGIATAGVKAGGAGLEAAAAAGVAATTAASNQAYSAITVIIGATTKIYTGLNTYRSSVVNELNTFLKNVDASAGSSKTGDTKAEAVPAEGDKGAENTGGSADNADKK